MRFELGGRPSPSRSQAHRFHVRLSDDAPGIVMALVVRQPSQKPHWRIKIRGYGRNCLRNTLERGVGGDHWLSHWERDFVSVCQALAHDTGKVGSCQWADLGGVCRLRLIASLTALGVNWPFLRSG